MRTPRASHVKTTKSTTWNADESQHTKVLAEKQLPACDRLGEQDRRRARLQKCRDESRRPHQGQQQSQGAGEAAGKEQFEERDGIAALAAHREGNGTERQGHAAADCFDSLPSSQLRIGFEGNPNLLTRCRHAEAARPRRRSAAGKAPARPRLERHVSPHAHAQTKHDADRGNRQHHPADSGRPGLPKCISDKLLQRDEVGPSVHGVLPSRAIDRLQGRFKRPLAIRGPDLAAERQGSRDRQDVPSTSTASRSQTCATSPRACETTSTVFAGIALLGDDLVKQQPRAQVEPFHRLVEDEQVRLREHALGQREALNHSLAEAGDRFMGTVGQPHSIEQRGHADSQDRRRNPRQFAVELEELVRGQVPGKRLVLVHVADAGERAPLRERAPQSKHAASARTAQAEEDLEQRRLAGPVGAQKREHLARFDPEADPSQGLDRSAGRSACPVRLGNIDELGDEIGHGYLIRAICTPFSRMLVNVLIMFVDICESVPVMI